MLFKWFWFVNYFNYLIVSSSSSSSSSSSFSFSFSLSSFSFLFSFSCFDEINVSSVKIVSNKSLNKFHNSFYPGVCLLYFIISAFFVSFNAFKPLLANSSLIALFLILLTKSLMLMYLNSSILFLWLNLLLSIIAKIF